MKEYVIFTDSSADFEQNMVDELDLQVLPLSFKVDGKEYKNWPDDRDIATPEVYKKLRSGSVVTTSQVNVSEFSDAFREILRSGKDILYLGFSSGLSGTVNSGKLAAEDVAPEFPDSKIIVIDTLCASLGQGLIIWHAVQHKRAGESIEEVADWVEKNKLHMAHWFTVDDLDFLKRGGRISGTAALFGSMLSIKPVMHMDNAGKLIPMEKARGRKKSLIALVDHMEQSGINPKDQTVFISHGDCLEEAQFVADEIKSRFGTQNFYINYVGPVIASHSGPNTMALFFLATER